MMSPAPPAPLGRGQVVATPRGNVITTGRVGNVQTTTLPNGGGQGMLINNGNGTSLLLAPDGAVTAVPTPR
jgi:hypothetical protein